MPFESYRAAVTASQLVGVVEIMLEVGFRRISDDGTNLEFQTEAYIIEAHITSPESLEIEYAYDNHASVDLFFIETMSRIWSKIDSVVIFSAIEHLPCEFFREDYLVFRKKYESEAAGLRGRWAREFGMRAVPTRTRSAYNRILDIRH